MYYVYVLLSLKDNKFYIGFSEDIKKRLADHNAVRNTSTKPRRLFKLIYYEAHLNKYDALRREAYFKTTKGKSTLKQMLRTTLAVRVDFDAQANKDYLSGRARGE